MKLFKSTDEKLEALGFKKTEDNKYGVEYERYNTQFKYTHVVHLMHKASGNHIMQSYSREGTTSSGSDVVGLTYKEMRLFTKKMKEAGLVN